MPISGRLLAMVGKLLVIVDRLLLFVDRLLQVVDANWNVSSDSKSVYKNRIQY